MAEDEKAEATARPEFPTGRVKKIMKLDKDINKVNSEALFLVSHSTELFLRFLAEKSAQVATEKKRKIVKLDHLCAAVKRHRPTSDFLLDSLPVPAQPSSERPKTTEKTRAPPVPDKPLPAGTRRIDDFFPKPPPANEAPVPITDS